MPQTQDATKTIEFEGKQHQFPADFSNDDIAKALKSYGAPAAKAATPSTTLTPPPTGQGDASKLKDAWTKMGRGAALGSASALGIPESTSSGEVVSGALKNTASGLAQMVENPIKATTNMAQGLVGAGKESWDGLQQHDPEMFAHGLGSLITQILTLKKAGESAVEGARKPVAGGAKAKVAAGAGITGDAMGSFERAWPTIVKQAARSGVDTVGKLVKTVETASKALDAKFNNALAPLANMPYIPTEIATRIKALITPDMAKTAAGRAEAAEIKAAAQEYDGRHWTLNELNAKRMTENDNLASFYNKDSQGQAASRVQQHISKAVRDGAAEIVYNEVGKYNPDIDAKKLKADQGALWDTRIHLEKRASDLAAKQLAHEGTGVVERLHGGAAVGSKGTPHGYIGNLTGLFKEGPADQANARIRSALNPSLSERAGRMGKVSLTHGWRAAVSALPIGALAGDRPTTKTGPPPSAEDDSE